MRHTVSIWSLALVVIFSLAEQALAKDMNCDRRSEKGDTCLCKISDLRPTQSSVGMVEVRIKADKLNEQLLKRSEPGLLGYLLKHEKEEPVIIGPQGIFYITDHHHLARALYDIGVSKTYCVIMENFSDTTQDDFWKRLKDNNEVYLRDKNGNPINPQDLPATVKDLSDNPFRSLAGEVRESCGFVKSDENSNGEDYLEFQWADYLRDHWSQTGIVTEAINTDFSHAVMAALELAAQNEASNLPGYTGKTSCK